MDNELAASARPCGPLDVEHPHHPTVPVHIPHLQRDTTLFQGDHECNSSFPLHFTLASSWWVLKQQLEFTESIGTPRASLYRPIKQSGQFFFVTYPQT